MHYVDEMCLFLFSAIFLYRVTCSDFTQTHAVSTVTNRKKAIGESLLGCLNN